MMPPEINTQRFYLLFVIICCSSGRIYASFDFGDYMSPEDLNYFWTSANDIRNKSPSTTPEGHWVGNRYWPEDMINDVDLDDGFERNSSVECFGVGSLLKSVKMFFNLRPLPSETVHTRFYLTTRKFSKRVEIPAGEQFGLEWTDYDPKKLTVIIVHGFLSYSNASWVLDLTNGFLRWKDVNVFTVDWSKGGQTWKYWRAVANTRTVGTDLTNFLIRLMSSTGLSPKDVHFVGHSLGAHICSFAGARVRGVGRITGLDPAQPCFRTTNKHELLDSTDAVYVDVIHTNGRRLSKIGFGLPDPLGHADFYPNGGMKQPGCYINGKKSHLYKYFPLAPERLQQAICSHGRSYILFTESLLGNCTFVGTRWNMTYEGINSSLATQCDNKRLSNCGVMGIDAYKPEIGFKSIGQFYVFTKDEQPFCALDHPKSEPRNYLVSDLIKGYRMNDLEEGDSEKSDIKNSESTTFNPKKSGWWIFGY